jgi:putative N-acetylmannosamine-6-phosphate epimerase
MLSQKFLKGWVRDLTEYTILETTLIDCDGDHALVDSTLDGYVRTHIDQLNDDLRDVLDLVAQECRMIATNVACDRNSEDTLKFTLQLGISIHTLMTEVEALAHRHIDFAPIIDALLEHRNAVHVFPSEVGV